MRAYLLSVISRFVELFAVDGVELCFRDNRYFPPGCGPEREHLMTELVRQVRALLDRTGAGRRLLLGCRVRPRKVPPGPDAAVSGADTRPFVTCWFPLTADLAVRGENRLELRLLHSDPEAREAAVVEEVEVYVVTRG